MSLVETLMTRLAAPAPRTARAFTLAVLAVFALQALFLAYMIGERAWLLRTGTEVTLAIVPVDPRDLFRGDYVVLSYEISRLDEQAMEGGSGFQGGDPVFLRLEERGGTWQPVSLHRARPDDGGIYIAGRVDYTTATPDRMEEGQARCEECRTLVLSYGIETYFIPEGTGRELEDSRNAGRLSARIALGKGGQAAIKALLLDGEAVHEEPLF